MAHEPEEMEKTKPTDFSWALVFILVILASALLGRYLGAIVSWLRGTTAY